MIAASSLPFVYATSIIVLAPSKRESKPFAFPLAAGYIMSNQSSIEQRLEALEREVAQIRQRLATPQANGNWVDEIAGSMKQFPEFDEVVRLGREFRETMRIPADE